MKAGCVRVLEHGYIEGVNRYQVTVSSWPALMYLNQFLLLLARNWGHKLNFWQAKETDRLIQVLCVSPFRLETFDADVRSLVAEYKALPAEAQNEEILGSFERIWKNGREKLALRLGRSMK